MQSKTTRSTNRYVLGLDLGVQSIGWALLRLNDQEQPISIERAGVRCFPVGVGTESDIEQGKEESPGKERRAARQRRRQTFRHAQRMRNVFRALQRAGLLPPGPATSAARHRLLQQLDQQLAQIYLPKDNPVAAHKLVYELRRLALDQKLEPYALGRALYHLAERRGFLSNRRAEKPEDQSGEVKQGIAFLSQEIQQSEARTLGEYFASLDPEQRRIRSRWTSRAMYEEEFEKIWAKQTQFYPHLESHKKEIHRAIFYQRPLKSQRGRVGFCELEPNRRRTMMGCLEYQRFRYLQKVNDLKIYSPNEDPRPLTSEEREKLIQFLEQNEEVTFRRICSLLNLPKETRFNLQEGGEKKIVGNRTAARIRKILGDRWDRFTDEEKQALVEDLLSFQKEEPLQRRLQNHWKLDPATAHALVNLPLEKDFAPFSRRALKRLLPYMQQGDPFITARDKVYPNFQSLQAQQTTDRLPPVLQVFPTLRNPVVLRTLSELRKVVNCLIALYGVPEFIRIELARDLRLTRQQRQKRTQQMRLREKERERAKKLLQEAGIQDPSRTDIDKVLLAEECNWECPYTGRRIELRALVGDNPQFDIEHIIPRSRSLDNSFANKTLCYHEENRNRKRGKTPWEAYGGDEARWREILARVRKFQGPFARRKLELFLLQQIPDDFVARQLQDTRYISRCACDYLALLYGGRTDAQGRQRIQTTKGPITAFVRRVLGLNEILGDPETKKREDHRHHAVDAITVALTSPSLVRAVTKLLQRYDQWLNHREKMRLPPPWENFLEEAKQQVHSTIVSHRPNRKVAGPLHDETFYAPRTTPDGQTVWTVRKPVADLSWEEIQRIFDPQLRKLIKDRIWSLSGETPKDDRPPSNFKAVQRMLRSPENLPVLQRARPDGTTIDVRISRVRIIARAKPIPIGEKSTPRYVVPGSNHHIEIVAELDEQGNEKRWRGIIVNRLQAYQRMAAGQPVVQRDHGPHRKFLFSLSVGDMVEITRDGKREICRVERISEKDIELCLHYDARTSAERAKIGKTARIRGNAEKLRQRKARKLLVDPIGRVFEAHD